MCQNLIARLDDIFNEIIENLKKEHDYFKSEFLKEIDLETVEIKQGQLEKQNNHLKKYIEFFNSDEKLADTNNVVNVINGLSLEEKEKMFEGVKNCVEDINKKIDSFLQRSFFFDIEINNYPQHFIQTFNEQKLSVDLSSFKFINTKIVPNNQIFFVLKQINKTLQTNLIDYELIFRASRDGYSAKNFHDLCDYKKPLLIIIKSDLDSIFGGFTTTSFYSGELEYQYCDKSFLFSVDKNFISPVKNFNKAIECNKKNGPIFGSIFYDLFIASNCNENEFSHTYNFGYSYSLPNDLVYETPEAISFLTGSKTGAFKVLDYEVWSCNYEIPEKITIF